VPQIGPEKPLGHWQKPFTYAPPFWQTAPGPAVDAAVVVVVVGAVTIPARSWKNNRKK